MKRMRYLIVTLLCAIAMQSVALQAAAAARRVAPVIKPAPPHAIEQALEVLMSAVRLPDGPNGFVLVTACPRCATVSLAVDARSRFVIDHAELPLATLRQRLLPGHLYAATILYSAADKRLTQLQVTSR